MRAPPRAIRLRPLAVPLALGLGAGLAAVGVLLVGDLASLRHA